MTYRSAVSLMQQSHNSYMWYTIPQGIKICPVGLPWNKAIVYCEISIDRYCKHQQAGKDDEAIFYPRSHTFPLSSACLIAYSMHTVTDQKLNKTGWWKGLGTQLATFSAQ